MDTVGPLQDASNRLSFENFDRIPNLKKQTSLATPTFRENSLRSESYKDKPNVNVRMSLDKEVQAPQRDSYLLQEYIAEPPPGIKLEPETIPLDVQERNQSKLRDLERKYLLHENGDFKPNIIKISYSDNSIYVGEVVAEDIREGEGIYYYSNLDIYAGGWRADKFHGKGIYIFHNGDLFEGNLDNGMKKGKGS
jgi:hypothetical protein